MLLKLANLIALASWVGFSGVDAQVSWFCVVVVSSCLLLYSPFSRLTQSDECLILKDCVAQIASFSGIPFESFGDFDAACEPLVQAYGDQGIAAICAAADVTNSGRRLAATKQDGLRGHTGAADSPIEDEGLLPGRHLQTCPSDYTPAYGEDEPTGGYDTFVASIVGTFIQDGKKERTSANDVGAYYIGFSAASLGAAAATGVPAVDNIAQAILAAFTIAIN